MIMCNPNALYYQQMVTSPNAYWLNFFLKRDINVLCWNYRGYGESTRGSLEALSPYKCKRDAEYVMAYLVNRLRVKGKIGVYGRSIGGLTACHLANKYNNLVKALIVDRSFYELSQVPEGKLKGGYTARVFDLLSWKWRTRNHSNFVTTSNCYKIITCDPLDDTVDLFGNLATGVASQLAKVDYETKQYRQFYESMLYIFAYESELYEGLSEDEKSALLENVTCAAEEAELKRLSAQRGEPDEIIDNADPSNSTSINSYHDSDEERTPVLPKKKKKNGRQGDLLYASFSDPDS